MILDWINRLYKYFILLFAMLAFLKIIATILMRKNTGGIIGLIFIIFKWFSGNDFELNDVEWQIKYMRWLNILTVFVYLSLFVLIVFTVIRNVV